MNKKVIIAIVVVIIVAILGVLMFLGNGNTVLSTTDASVTLPNNYTLDNKGVAYCGDVGVYFTSVTGGSKEAQDELFKALESNGKDAGYNKVKTDNVNGYKTYQYSANPKNLKNISTDKVYYGNQYSWKEYEPYVPFKDVSDMKVKNFRYVAFVKDDKINELYIFTNNTDVDLYSSEFDNIINSIAPLESK